MLFALWCTDKKDHLQVRMDTRPTHVEWLNAINAEGKLKMAGPTLNGEGKPMGSLVVIVADDQASAEALAAQDPYAKAGLFETVEVRPFNWVFNNPEA
ncbi:YciI-like protein [Rhizobium sp. C4]|uniref:YciI-like protein n=1 Tax=Rhizobium sp. C4 TaxID=1349800 RepID=UPI001E5FA98A|nr:YciI-like protein [Rhizobium sp. C4]MCD2175480.1 YciI family protein [Rhizobium sp. C4]